MLDRRPQRGSSMPSTTRETLTALRAATLVIALLATSVGADAQQATTRRIGFLAASSAATTSDLIQAFSRRLQELGWIEGRNITVDYRYADGRAERFEDFAGEFVAAKVDVIVTWGTATVLATKRATSVIPIVFALAADPVGDGLVASLARPGGNVTGLSTQHADASAKRLELLGDIVPNLRRLAIMANAGNPASVAELRDVQKVARTRGLDVVIAEMRQTEDIVPAFEALSGKADALFVAPDAFLNTQRARLGALALKARLPTMYGHRWLDVLWTGLRRPLPASCRLRRQDPAWSETRRSSRRAADQARAGRQ